MEDSTKQTVVAIAKFELPLDETERIHISALPRIFGTPLGLKFKISETDHYWYVTPNEDGYLEAPEDFGWFGSDGKREIELDYAIPLLDFKPQGKTMKLNGFTKEDKETLPDEKEEFQQKKATSKEFPPFNKSDDEEELKPKKDAFGRLRSVSDEEELVPKPVKFTGSIQFRTKAHDVPAKEPKQKAQKPAHRLNPFLESLVSSAKNASLSGRDTSSATGRDSSFSSRQTFDRLNPNRNAPRESPIRRSGDQESNFRNQNFDRRNDRYIPRFDSRRNFNEEANKPEGYGRTNFSARGRSYDYAPKISRYERNDRGYSRPNTASRFDSRKSSEKPTYDRTRAYNRLKSPKETLSNRTKSDWGSFDDDERPTARKMDAFGKKRQTSDDEIEQNPYDNPNDEIQLGESVEKESGPKAWARSIKNNRSEPMTEKPKPFGFVRKAEVKAKREKPDDSFGKPRPLDDEDLLPKFAAAKIGEAASKLSSKKQQAKLKSASLLQEEKSGSKPIAEMGVGSSHDQADHLILSPKIAQLLETFKHKAEDS